MRIPAFICGLVCVMILIGGAAAEPDTHYAPAPPGEVRALWVVRTSLTSPESIAAMVASAKSNGFNTLLVQVRGRGDAFFSSRLEPRATLLNGQEPDFDPLQHVLSAAHAAGLRVHAWVNVNLVASAAILPPRGDHIVYRHPDWLMVPRALAAELNRVSPASDRYLTRLAQWTRSRTNRIEGLYASPLHPDAAAHAVAIVSDLVQRYPLDGVHLDYVRLPNSEFDYSRRAIAEFRAEIAPELAPGDRQRLDRRSAIDVFAYPDTYPARWAEFRRARVTSLVTRIREAVKAARPEALLTAAVFPDADEAYHHRFQDWRGWTATETIDAICPMAYTTDPVLFAQQIAAAQQIAGPSRVWAGIGAYRLSATQTIANIFAARRAGAGGIVLFSYDSLVDPSQHQTDYLGAVGRATFDDTIAPASAPHDR